MLLDHIRQDWSVRVPCLLRCNRRRGLNGQAYVLLCILYHLVKTVVLFYIFVCYRCAKFIFWDIWAHLFAQEEEDDYDDEEEEEPEEDAKEEEAYCDEREELPFCQLFTVGNEMCLLIDHVEMCPDETAFIRVVDDEGYTPLYKRKVKHDKLKNRYITFSGRDYYLDDNKTRPTVSGRK